MHERLTKEIEYWDDRAQRTSSEQADAGKQPRMNPERARARADDSPARLGRAMTELDREQQLRRCRRSSSARALVVPAAAHSAQRRRSPSDRSLRAANRRSSAAPSMRCSPPRRRSAARSEEMPHNNPGFDIRSRAPDGDVRFIEVKGRIAGAETFTVTRNEILHALNVPDAYVLALVEVSPDGAADDRVRYLRRPFGDAVHLPFATTCADSRLGRVLGAGTVPA